MDKTKGGKSFEVSKPCDMRRKKWTVVKSATELKRSSKDASHSRKSQATEIRSQSMKAEEAVMKHDSDSKAYEDWLEYLCFEGHKFRE